MFDIGSLPGYRARLQRLIEVLQQLSQTGFVLADLVTGRSFAHDM